MSLFRFVLPYECGSNEERSKCCNIAINLNGRVNKSAFETAHTVHSLAALSQCHWRCHDFILSMTLSKPQILALAVHIYRCCCWCQFWTFVHFIVIVYYLDGFARRLVYKRKRKDEIYLLFFTSLAAIMLTMRASH